MQADQAQEAILAMVAGKKLDALIEEQHFNRAVILGEIQGREVCLYTIPPEKIKEGYLPCMPAPEYSTDISAAWLVLDTTKFDCVWRILQGSLGIKYCVGYARGVDTVAGLICYAKNLHPEDCLSPVCDTFPEAVCKAALLAKMSE